MGRGQPIHGEILYVQDDPEGVRPELNRSLQDFCDFVFMHVMAEVGGMWQCQPGRARNHKAGGT
jgi:hypothetical protein